jgi:hypothetical protein
MKGAKQEHGAQSEKVREEQRHSDAIDNLLAQGYANGDRKQAAVYLDVLQQRKRLLKAQKRAPEAFLEQALLRTYETTITQFENDKIIRENKINFSNIKRIIKTVDRPSEEKGNPLSRASPGTLAGVRNMPNIIDMVKILDSIESNLAVLSDVQIFKLKIFEQAVILEINKVILSINGIRDDELLYIENKCQNKHTARFHNAPEIILKWRSNSDVLNDGDIDTLRRFAREQKNHELIRINHVQLEIQNIQDIIARIDRNDIAGIMFKLKKLPLIINMKLIIEKINENSDFLSDDDIVLLKAFNDAVRQAICDHNLPKEVYRKILGFEPEDRFVLIHGSREEESPLMRKLHSPQSVSSFYSPQQEESKEETALQKFQKIAHEANLVYLAYENALSREPVGQEREKELLIQQYETLVATARDAYKAYWRQELDRRQELARMAESEYQALTQKAKSLQERVEQKVAEQDDVEDKFCKINEEIEEVSRQSAAAFQKQKKAKAFAKDAREVQQAYSGVAQAHRAHAKELYTAEKAYSLLTQQAQRAHAKQPSTVCAYQQAAAVQHAQAVQVEQAAEAAKEDAVALTAQSVAEQCAAASHQACFAEAQERLQRLLSKKKGLAIQLNQITKEVAHIQNQALIAQRAANAAKKKANERKREANLAVTDVTERSFAVTPPKEENAYHGKLRAAFSPNHRRVRQELFCVTQGAIHSLKVDLPTFSSSRMK